ncbi:hypothetical protein LUZ60_011653 [Juncus effusus]|nr:hypothetical protein LUZ60_011653 [Juncus effusus]
MEDFYELELNIKDLKTLNQSLDQYLSVEELQGENQYFCDSCSERVDATRCIKLRCLPRVLNLQLKRYVFLPKTTTKKKITSSFSFPRRLDMRNRLTLIDPSFDDNSQSCFKYELSAILIHKGTTVNSGHYVAHIKDELTGLWWEFDDEHVSELGPHPFGEKNKEKEKENNNKHKNNNGSNSNGLESNGKHEEGEEEEMFSSNDCYMLMYKQQTSINKENNTNNCNNNLPSYYSEEIEKLNEAYERECQEYERVKEEKLKFITERREEVKSVLAEAPVERESENDEENNEIYFWISTEWLRQWADNIEPPPLDNSGILCEHGKVPVSKVNSMKRISAMAWQLLHSKYGGGPALSSEDYCAECLKRGADSAVSADVYREQKASFKDLAESSLAGKPVEHPSYFVSRTWLSHWMRRKNSDRCESDAGPTRSLTCPHGSLLPELAPGAKRVSVPENLWLFLYESCSNGKREADDDVATFPADLAPCEVCSVELNEVACVEDNLRAMKSKLRQNHEKLISGKSFVLNLEQNYNLVPAKWLAQWRAYVTATGKNISSFSEPDSFESALDSLLCDKHSMLLERPLELVCKRGVITQKVSSNEGLIIIPEADWIKFCEEWNVQESKGISCQIAFVNHENKNKIINNINNNNNNKEKNKISGSSKDEPISVEENNNNTDTTMEETNDDSDSRKPYIKTRIKVCEECIGERESCLLMQKLNYKNENISVYFVRGKEAPKSIQNGSSSDPERRVSKRSRKSNYGNSVSLTVSGSTSLYQLKMMIWEAFGVVKENQKLHKGSVEIEGDSSDTLADKNIFPGDVLWVKDSEIYENRDIADELAEGKLDVKKTEEGFRGTLLTSDISNNIYGEN